MKALGRWAKGILKDKVIPPYLITWNARTPRPRVSLTFDDGPCPKTTPRILDRLRRAGAHATFFVIGERAAKNRTLLEAIAAGGHELGCHGYTHKRPRELTSREELRSELRKTNDIIEATTFCPVRLFRPPYGEMNLALIYETHRALLRPVLWNKDTLDARGATPKATLPFELRPGDIVLMHDEYAGPWLEVILEEMTERGLGSLTVSGLLTDDEPA